MRYCDFIVLEAILKMLEIAINRPIHDIEVNCFKIYNTRE